MSMTQQITGYLGDIFAQVPDSPAVAPDGVGDRFENIIGFAKWIGYLICALALIAGAVRLAIVQQGGHLQSDGVGGIAKPVFAVVLIGLAPTIISWFI